MPKCPRAKNRTFPSDESNETDRAKRQNLTSRPILFGSGISPCPQPLTRNVNSWSRHTPSTSDGSPPRPCPTSSKRPGSCSCRSAGPECERFPVLRCGWHHYSDSGSNPWKRNCGKCEHERGKDCSPGNWSCPFPPGYGDDLLAEDGSDEEDGFSLD